MIAFQKWAVAFSGNWRAPGLLLAACLFLSACSDSASELISKSSSARYSSQLIDKIGRPDKVRKSGSLQVWIYEVSDGTVEFKVQNGKVTLGRVAMDKS